MTVAVYYQIIKTKCD